jgi:hypothetical protein
MRDERFFNALRTVTERRNVLIAALRASAWKIFLMAAVMAA